jgi:hypothetical protein
MSAIAVCSDQTRRGLLLAHSGQRRSQSPQARQPVRSYREMSVPGKPERGFPDTKKLTLENVSPITIMFTDRPERIASHMRTAKFVPFWSHGKDSFLSDPPNADVSLLEGDKLQQFVVTLMDPAIEGDNLSYMVKVLEGEMPAKGADASVFIDIIGMPLTPLSFAGARRRAWRRAVYY